MKIAFIGTGVMGSAMVKNLLKAGFTVNVYNRTASKAQALTSYGANFCASIKDCVEAVDVVITIVGYPKNVESCYKEIFSHAKEGTVLIDMTTSSPALANTIYKTAKAAKMFALDAPVSGGDIGAINGKLTIMVGGDENVYQQVLPIFQAMGTTINYIGQAGSGQHCKMANQIAIAGNIAGAMEAITYALKNKLDYDRVYQAISKGSAASFQLDYASKKIKTDDYKPGFFIKHFIKDMKIAKAEADRQKLLLPVLEQVLKQFEVLADKGYGDLGTQALFKYYQES